MAFEPQPTAGEVCSPDHDLEPHAGLEPRIGPLSVHVCFQSGAEVVRDPLRAHVLWTFGVGILHVRLGALGPRIATTTAGKTLVIGADHERMVLGTCR